MLKKVESAIASTVAFSQAAFMAVVAGMRISAADKARNPFMFAAMRGASMTSYVIGIAVAGLVVAIIVPIAFGQFFATSTASWDSQTILIWGIIPLVMILAIVLFFLNKADEQS